MKDHFSVSKIESMVANGQMVDLIGEMPKSTPFLPNPAKWGFQKLKRGKYKITRYGIKLRAGNTNIVPRKIGEAIVSNYYQTLMPIDQRENAKLWGMNDASWTKWGTTLGYGLSFLYEYGPLIGGSMLTEGISLDNDLAMWNFYVGTGINLARAVLAFGFNKPSPPINLPALLTNVPKYSLRWKKRVGWKKTKDLVGDHGKKEAIKIIWGEIKHKEWNPQTV